MKILITRSTIIQDLGHVDSGTQVDVDKRTATDLLAMQKALPVPEAPKEMHTRTPKPKTKAKPAAKKKE